MRKIRKMQSGFSFPSLSSEFITGASYIKLTPYINSLLQQYITKTGNFAPIKNPSSTNNTGNLAVANGINAISSQLTQRASDKIFGDSELGRGLGTLFSSGVNSATNTMGNNILKGAALSEGVMQNAGASLAGAGAGLAANYIGLGINSLGGNSMLSRGIGLGVATGLGTVGGTALSNLITSGSVAGNASKLFGTAGKGWQAFSTGKTGIDAAGNVTKAAGAINPYALGATVVGSALGAATGPSKEYGGRYGKITQGMDMAYDALSVGANFIPGIGLGISAAMVLNKGLSNIFGSTSGMTKTDAILGSAFMPAPVKWLNMAGAHKTGTFNNLSWQNQEKASSFMQDAFGNLLAKFDKAREEAGKTYGTFSRGAYNRAQNNLNFANKAWGQIMAMADLNELLNIRSLYMTSINNLRYAQDIQGGWSPLVRGKQGMKIFNNATNHNIGMRLLSAAALIDSGLRILSAQNGTKVKIKKYLAKSTGRVWNTKEEAIRDNANYKKNVHYRYNIKSGNYKSSLKNYNIPFIPKKKITLTNAGLATGAVLSTNLLDSIAVNAERAGLPIKTAIGLATKESTLNNPTYDLRNRAKIAKFESSLLKRARMLGNEKDIKPIQNIDNGDTSEGLLINYNPNDNPYESGLGYIFKKAKTWEDNLRMMKENEAYADRQALRNQAQPSKSYLQAGFETYKKNPQGYNPGQPNYVQLVQQRANEVWNSPEIQKWYKTYKQSKK